MMRSYNSERTFNAQVESIGNDNARHQIRVELVTEDDDGDTRVMANWYLDGKFLEKRSTLGRPGGLVLLESPGAELPFEESHALSLFTKLEVALRWP